MTRKDKTSPGPANASKAQEEGEIARKVWLAGVGAYGRAISEAQESLSRFGLGTSKMFDDLVRRGQEIEEGLESRRRDLSDKLGSSVGVPFQDRVNEMREKLKRHVVRGDDTRLAEIEARLARIEELLEGALPQASPPKRKSARASTRPKNDGAG